MPTYPGTGQATLLNTNSQVLLFNNEREVGGGNASIAVQLERQKSAFYPFGASYEISFGGAPGTFEIDIQNADTDADKYYVTMNQVTAVNANNVARVELPSSYMKYTRVKVVTLTNDVTVTVRVTR
jgi:hypothetical protein